VRFIRAWPCKECRWERSFEKFLSTEGELKNYSKKTEVGKKPQEEEKKEAHFSPEIQKNLGFWGGPRKNGKV